MEEMQKTMKGYTFTRSSSSAFLDLVACVEHAENAYVLENSSKERIAKDALLKRIRQYKGKIDLGINLDEMRAR